MGDELPPLTQARWPQVDSADRRVLLWPIGSTEQHGPHLPLSTDTVVASALAQRVHQLHPSVGLAPALPVGASGEHREFPGTLSIGSEALSRVLVEFTRHATQFWQHVVVVNGHGGNVPSLRAAERLLTYERRSFTAYTSATAGHRADAHAGYLETSLLLHLRPDLVRHDLAAPGATATLRHMWELLSTRGVRAVSPNGVLGDPTGATPEAGAAFFDDMLRPLVDLVEHLLVDG